MSDATHEPPLPPEPQTPMWLTAVGGVLLFCVAIWFLATSTGKASGAADADAGAPATSASAAKPTPPGSAKPAAAH